ncbi:MAG: DNA-3-methyladenine glycosylase [Deltaproteobacteria bacterium]|nr:DNA-3-methyladenine glycosylase [Deltaproteobacteria bacterium]
MKPLPRAFFAAKTIAVAKALLGCRIVRRHGDGRVQVARIVETEAYLGEHDLAAHSAKGRTARTETMFGPPGHAYVYMIYGMHFCLNFVTEPGGHASAVLIRGAEPVSGISDRTDGPGRLARALAIDRTLNAVDLTKRGALYVAASDADVGKILRGPRIGVDYAGAWAKKPLRFWVAASSHVSR